MRQAQEISSYHFGELLTAPIYLDLPSKLSEAYNNPGSRYRYAVRDEAGQDRGDIRPSRRTAAGFYTNRKTDHILLSTGPTLTNAAHAGRRRSN